MRSGWPVFPTLCAWPDLASESSAPPARSARSRSSCSPSAATTCARSRRRARPARASRSATTRSLVEEATPEALSAGDVDLFLFSVGTGASRELVPIASAAGAICIDKSSAYRLVDGYPLVVPEVNAARALEALERDRIVANPNCCTIPLTCVLKPLHDVVPLRRVHVATYQSVSGAGAQRMEQLRAEPSSEHNLVMDWSWEGDESDEESKLRAETRKILELPDLAISATCVRVPVLVGHSEAIWVEFEEPLSPGDATAILERGAERPRPRLPEFPTPKDAAGGDEVLVGRIREDEGSANGLALFLACDNLQEGSSAERDPDRRGAARRCRGAPRAMAS